MSAERNIINPTPISPEYKEFIDALDLREQNDHCLYANTPHGRREVHVSSVSFKPVIYYVEHDIPWVVVIPGLNPLLLPQGGSGNANEDILASEKQINHTRRQLHLHFKNNQLKK